MHVRLVKFAIEKLDVAATAVDVLLVLYGELDHQRLVPVKKYCNNKMTTHFGKVTLASFLQAHLQNMKKLLDDSFNFPV